MQKHEWRDCQAWREEGLDVSTTSNEAAKLYDVCLTQFVGFYDDPQMGGLVKSMEAMNKADSNFVLGLALSLGIKIIGVQESVRTCPPLQEEYNTLKSILEAQKTNITQREQFHVKAIMLFADGKASKAVEMWEEILLDHPTDILALKMADIVYIYLGDFQRLRDSVARVLPVWEAKRPPMKSYIYGFYSYGLEETGQYTKAEMYAKKGLEENPIDGWTTHAYAHIFEMEGRTNEGIQFMNSTVQNWEKANQLACHNYWHTALYHCENEEYESAVEILENQILKRAAESTTMFKIYDLSSLIYRIHLTKPSNVKERHWTEAYEMSKAYSKHHISTFNDSHLMMIYAGCNKQQSIDEMLETISENNGELAGNSNTTELLLKSMIDFENEKYEKVVDSLEPIRYSLCSIGGSGAQRDVFSLFLITAALKSPSLRHKKLAKILINERETNKKPTALSATLRNSSLSY